MKQNYSFQNIANFIISKQLIFAITMLLLTNVSIGQTTLTEGDFAFTRINMDDETFSFVLLIPIDNGTNFFITDETWNASNQQGTSESTIEFTATSSFGAGEEISITPTSMSFSSSGSGTATIVSVGAISPTAGNMLGSAGDNLFIYQCVGIPTANDFIAGITANTGVIGSTGNAWQIVSTTSTSSTQLPSGLTNSSTALGLFPNGGAQTEVDNCRYKPSALHSGDKATILAAIMDRSNWEFNNSIPFSVSTTSFSINALPVELISFTTTFQMNQTVQLDWITASELNNNHFEIERSYTGTTWENIGSVDGNGNSIELIKYRYLDNAMASDQNIIYYRLKQLDNDDTFEYSKVSVVDLNGRREVELDIYPNPVSNSLNIIGLDKTAIISIINYRGITVMQGKYTTTGIDVSELSLGTYYIQINTNNQLVTRKMIKR